MLSETPLPNEYLRLKKKHPEIYKFACDYLAKNENATHKEIVSAIYTEFGRHHVSHSHEIGSLADAAYYERNRDQTAGLPLFDEKGE